MTAGATMGRRPKRLALPAALLVDMPCERGCQVELDLSAAVASTPLGSLVEAARVAHDQAHAAEPRRIHQIDATTLVRCHGGQP